MHSRESSERLRAGARAIALVGSLRAASSGGVAGTLSRFITSLEGLIEAEWEARRFFLWLAPLSMVGVLVYFAAEDEPALWAGPALCCVSCGLLWVMRDASRAGRGMVLALLAVGFGFTAGTLRTRWADAPILPDTRIGHFEAVIETIDWSDTGARLQLRALMMRGHSEDLPFRVRASLAGHPTIQPGDRIMGTIRLQPPPFPARPGGYDFARDAYFARIGAVGSIMGGVTLVPETASWPWTLSLMTRIDRLRIALTERIYRSIGGQSGAVTAALFTGKRGYISDATNDALRAAGIYHVVSISGLHMVLVAGMVFAMVRMALVLIPGFALRFPVKRWAALAAMIGAFAYDIFAGSEVATERSLIMVLILFGAMVMGRRALSMRNLVIAALIIIAMEPESILGPSFQMSFAAVAALVAAFERLPPPPDRPLAFVVEKERASQAGPKASLLGTVQTWLVTHVKTVLLTTLLCEAATGPFSAFHFQRIQPLGAIGNGLTIPLVEALAMPIGFFGVLAMPFGIDKPFWWVAGFCVDVMIWVSNHVAQIPFATHTLPAISLPAVLCLVFGMVWIVLWSTRLRLAGIFPVLIGVALAFFGDRADIVIARDGQGLAARGPDGALSVMGKGTSSFVVAQWLAADGDMRQPNDPTLKKSPLCNVTGCVFTLQNGKTLTLTLRQRDFSDDCAMAKVLVTPLLAPDPCAPMTIDKALLQSRGSVELIADGKGSYAIRGARSADYNRPWSPKPFAAPPPVIAPDAEGIDPTQDPITPR
jgi:competence protein ComEC